jgi:pSer/pThr/pTyr-binding forkhead associated (FHA) protein
MNYVLQIVRGRSETKMLKLIDGVNSIGRHDDCLIRIRSAQVSRRHCEIVAEGNTLMVRDLGSSNGTFVNGKRVLGKQALKPGDVLTIGGVTLRLDLLQGAAKPGAATAVPKATPGDTAEVDALLVPEEELELEFDEEEEFEIAIDDEPEHIDIIPLEDEPAPTPPKKAAQPAAQVAPGPREQPQNKSTGAEATTDVTKPRSSPDEEDAVAQFLMDLKLDEDE